MENLVMLPSIVRRSRFGKEHIERPWTEAEMEYVKENLRRLTMTQIGNHIGRTRNSVAGKIYRMGWRREL